jgi:prephenate dehydratase
MKVAFLGGPGTFSEQAAHEYFSAFEPLSCASFNEVFDAVESGACDAAIIPIENSQAGSIRQNRDLLQQRNVHIIGETVLRVRHYLIGLPGAEKGGILRVVSHPQPLAQCAQYLQRMKAQTEDAVDTISAVKLVLERNDPSLAAIASSRAAELHGLSILEEGIEDDPNNHTRFYVIAVSPSLDATPPLA